MGRFMVILISCQPFQNRKNDCDNDKHKDNIGHKPPPTLQVIPLGREIRLGRILKPNQSGVTVGLGLHHAKRLPRIDCE